MRRIACMLILAIGSCCAGETLRDGLHQAGIPQTAFTSAELSQEINSASGSNGTLSYLAYMRVGPGNQLTGLPQIVRYDSATGKVMRKALDAGNPEQCCGSPLDIEFTQNYVLASFDDTPSAGVTLVIDRNLRLVEILFGFGFEELAPDQVVFIENMIHFAAQHPERLAFVDLPSGHAEELYPPKGDALRNQFARQNEQHMPSPAQCMQTNDPCDPKLFDEDIEFLLVAPDQFAIHVTRSAAHPEATHDDLPFQDAIYKYQRVEGKWLYCEIEWHAPQTQPHHRRPSPWPSDAKCTPTLPVLANTGGLLSPFPFVRRTAR